METAPASLRASASRLSIRPGGAPRANDLGHRAELLGAGVLVGERNLHLRAQHGERRAQLVRRVGHEAPLARERGLQAGEHSVEGLGQLAQLVVRAVEVDAAIERLSDTARAAPTISRSGRRRAPGRHPAEQDRDGRDREEVRVLGTELRSTSAATRSESVRWKWRSRSA